MPGAQGEVYVLLEHQLEQGKERAWSGGEWKWRRGKHKDGCVDTEQGRGGVRAGGMLSKEMVSQ